ncbi:DUF4097 family beta strand repeat-containing protein [Cellulosimicrobium sp. ES-005]|uniref:DUF4097 family beta strand repeat-containing protein n=1 Tax=Cellulosimicrobium sp. ES-005 TaxID=3163031 RepID=A0AAU8G4G4_9MICO
MTQESWTVTGPQAIDLARVRTLDATVIGGRIDVVAHDDPTRTDTRVEVHSVVGRPLEVRLEGTTLRVGYGPFVAGWKGFLERFRTYTGKDAADVHVAVPATTTVKVATVQGEALVAGVRDGARLATVSGSVMTSRTRGELRVDTVSGEVSASEHDGPVRMDSVSGGLTATGALRSLRLDSVSGSVTVDTRTTPSEITVSAVSADVLVRLPDPDAMDYAIRCVSGRLLVDGTEQRGSARSFHQPARTGAGSPVRVSAVSGDVTVLRGAPDETSWDAAGHPVEDAPVDADAPAWGSPGARGAAPSSGPVDR